MNTEESIFQQLSASSSSSSSSQSYVNSQGAGASSSATATSPSGETSSREQSTFVPGATSASASASATASDQGANTSATVSVPAEEQGGAESPDEASSPDADEDGDIGSAANTTDTDSQATGIVSLSLLIDAPNCAVDGLLGLPDKVILVGGDHPTIGTDRHGEDLLMLSATGHRSVEIAHIDFSLEQGEQLHLPASLSLSDIILEPMAVDHSNGLSYI